MTGPRIGSLCSGYGGLDMAVQSVFGGDIAWFFEYDKAPSKILAYHWPDIPNYGDMTKADWAGIEQVDILCGGTPCQDLSGAGKRAGMTEGTRSNLWVQMREAIAIQKPSIVIWENVRGAYSACADSEMGRCPRCMGLGGEHRPFLRALGRVLGDLSALGYDSKWIGVRASDIGAPHERYRVFVVAHPADDRRARARAPRHGRFGFENDGAGEIAPNALSDESERWGRQGNLVRSSGSRESGDGREQRNSVGDRSSVAAYASSGGELEGNDDAGLRGEGIDWAGLVDERRTRPGGTQWGIYAAAIEQWEALTRPAPAATEPREDGAHRLSPRFAEWMMGAPVGHITSPEIGLTRDEQFRAIGNGVVTQQATYAIERLAA